MYDTATRVQLVKMRMQAHEPENENTSVQILVHFPVLEEQNALCSMLQDWRELSCVSMDILAVQKNTPIFSPAILFWDLDSPCPPPVNHSPDCALFLCSGNHQRSIDSYMFHPTGFFTKPISREHLWSAMLRCADLWFPSLMRLEILKDRVKMGIPLNNLAWIEGTRRGCLLHTSHQSIPIRKPLYQLEQCLPSSVFARCQRSFLVNLNHVQKISGNSLFLNDGTELSLGRGSRATILDAYHQFCQRRYGK